MVLAVDGQLMTFEDDGQRSGATGNFIVCCVHPSAAHESGGAAPSFSVEVKYGSKRRAAMRMLGILKDSLDEEERKVTIVIEAGPAGNMQWQKMLSQISRRPSQQTVSSFDSLGSQCS